MREIFNAGSHLLLSPPTMCGGVSSLLSVNIAPKKPILELLVLRHVVSLKFMVDQISSSLRKWWECMSQRRKELKLPRF